MTLRFLPVLRTRFRSALRLELLLAELRRGTVEKGEQCVAVELAEEVTEIDFDEARAAAPR